MRIFFSFLWENIFDCEISNKPSHEKMYLRTPVPSKDSDEPVYSYILISHCCPLQESFDLRLFQRKHLFWYSLEAHHQGASNGYPQHTFPWSNRKNTNSHASLSHKKLSDLWRKSEIWPSNINTALWVKLPEDDILKYFLIFPRKQNGDNLHEMPNPAFCEK